MFIATMRGAVDILEKQEVECSLEYPGLINVMRNGWIYVFGDANDEFGADAYPNWEAYEKGEAPEPITTPLSSDCSEAATVAKAILDAVASHQKLKAEPHFFVLNETDGILATPEPLTREECDEFMAQFRVRFTAQGYYRTADGQRIPVAEVRLKRIPVGEL